jgi:hypothetical protein
VALTLLANTPNPAILPDINPVIAPYIRWKKYDPPTIIGYNP